MSLANLSGKPWFDTIPAANILLSCNSISLSRANLSRIGCDMKPAAGLISWRQEKLWTSPAKNFLHTCTSAIQIEPPFRDFHPGGAL